MAGVTAFFVSKRLLRPLMVVLCLLAGQMALTVASCHPEPTPMAARLAH